MTIRQIQSRDRRIAAAEASARRPGDTHRSNGDELRLRGGGDDGGGPTYAGNFTKCLPHDEHGFLQDPDDYSEWVRAIDTGDARDFRGLRMGPGEFTPDGRYKDFDADGAPVHQWAFEYENVPEEKPGVRAWESQGAGLTFDLEGADAQAFTMPPAPSADSQELIAEMAEVYWMALTRDAPFSAWDTDGGIDAARESLKRFWWFRADRTADLDGVTDRLPASLDRRRILSPDGDDKVPLELLFRGSTPGEQVGPYLSQFMLIGNTGINSNDPDRLITDGLISYGSMRIDQRVRVATPEADYMTDWKSFLDVQNGADVGRRETYVADDHRFIATPRDLATYVHYDALYQAYLNACLILLGTGAKGDPGLPFQLPDWRDKQQGFAQFGGPHILTLVTEVATRALKAVRFQKFNVHRRLRPEAVGGWMYQLQNSSEPEVLAKLTAFETMRNAFDGSSGVGAALGTKNEDADNWLLPMAFREGSPAHPSYGAGHATVAGACVTLLKAWFDHGRPLLDAGNPVAYEANADGSVLDDVSGTLDAPLTVEGELNKLAANISIGRNWAGVHYYSDYIESFKLGERIALSLLEEQKLTYGEAFSLSVPLHDGTTVRI